MTILGDDAVESGALERGEPAVGDRGVRGDAAGPDRRRGTARPDRLQQSGTADPKGSFMRSARPSARASNPMTMAGSARRACRYATWRVDPLAERIPVEAVDAVERPCDADLAVEHDACRVVRRAPPPTISGSTARSLPRAIPSQPRRRRGRAGPGSHPNLGLYSHLSPSSVGAARRDGLREHWRDGRVHGEVHDFIVAYLSCCAALVLPVCQPVDMPRRRRAICMSGTCAPRCSPGCSRAAPAAISSCGWRI